MWAGIDVPYQGQHTLALSVLCSFLRRVSGTCLSQLVFQVFFPDLASLWCVTCILHGQLTISPSTHRCANPPMKLHADTGSIPDQFRCSPPGCSLCLHVRVEGSTTLSVVPNQSALKDERVISPSSSESASLQLTNQRCSQVQHLCCVRDCGNTTKVS